MRMEPDQDPPTVWSGVARGRRTRLRVGCRAGRLPDEERFAGLAHRVAVTGAPVLNDAIAFLDCKVVQAFAAGDHTIFVGEVLSGDVQHPDQTPLLYFNGKYRDLGGEITE